MHVASPCSPCTGAGGRGRNGCERAAGAACAQPTCWCRQAGSPARPPAQPLHSHGTPPLPARPSAWAPPARCTARQLARGRGLGRVEAACERGREAWPARPAAVCPALNPWALMLLLACARPADHPPQQQLRAAPAARAPARAQQRGAVARGGAPAPPLAPAAKNSSADGALRMGRQPLNCCRAKRRDQDERFLARWAVLPLIVDSSSDTPPRLPGGVTILLLLLLLPRAAPLACAGGAHELTARRSSARAAPSIAGPNSACREEGRVWGGGGRRDWRSWLLCCGVCRHEPRACAWRALFALARFPSPPEPPPGRPAAEAASGAPTPRPKPTPGGMAAKPPSRTASAMGAAAGMAGQEAVNVQVVLRCRCGQVARGGGGATAVAGWRVWPHALCSLAPAPTQAPQQGGAGGEDAAGGKVRRGDARGHAHAERAGRQAADDAHLPL